MLNNRKFKDTLNENIRSSSYEYTLFKVQESLYRIMSNRGYVRRDIREGKTDRKVYSMDEVFDPESKSTQLERFQMFYDKCRLEKAIFNKENGVRLSSCEEIISFKGEVDKLTVVGMLFPAIYKKPNSNKEICSFMTTPENAKVLLGKALLFGKFTDPDTKKKKSYSHRQCILTNPTELSLEDEVMGEGKVNIIEILHFQQLMFDPLRHYRSPMEMTVLSEEENIAFRNLPAMKKYEPQDISVSDPAAIFLNAEVGDIIRILNTTVYTGQSFNKIGYRKVIY